MRHEVSSFLSACAPFRDLVFFAKEVDALAEQGEENSAFFSFDEQDSEDAFRQFSEAVAWPAVAMATVKPEGGERLVVALGPQGSFWEGQPLSLVERVGRIAVRGQVRAVVAIEDELYACGMGRAVLRRRAPGDWVDFGPPDESGERVVGFEALAGRSQRELYAAGWAGELWHFDGKTWRRRDLGVTSTLNAVCCAGEDVFVAGDDGVLFRGRGERWTALDAGGPNDLLDLAWSDGTLFALTASSLFTLGPGGLVPHDFPGAKSTLLRLLPAADGLLVLGEKELWRRAEGGWHALV